MKTKCTFADEIRELDEQVVALSDATRTITDSDNLKQFLKMLLAIGNKMNEGTNKGAATGFKPTGLRRAASADELRQPQKAQTGAHEASASAGRIARAWLSSPPRTGNARSSAGSGRRRWA